MCVLCVLVCVCLLGYLCENQFEFYNLGVRTFRSVLPRHWPVSRSGLKKKKKKNTLSKSQIFLLILFVQYQLFSNSLPQVVCSVEYDMTSPPPSGGNNQSALNASQRR